MSTLRNGALSPLEMPSLREANLFFLLQGDLRGTNLQQSQKDGIRMSLGQPNEKESTVQETIDFLNELANRLENWANESRTGGWSTHQVDANRKAADDCRREAARVKVFWDLLERND